MTKGLLGSTLASTTVLGKSGICNSERIRVAYFVGNSEEQTDRSDATNKPV